MVESRYEKYVTRKPAIIKGIGPDGKVKFKVPETGKIPLQDETTTGPRLIFANDFVKEAATKVEYGFIMKDTTLLSRTRDYGAHKHDYAEIFLFFGNDPYDTTYLGGEGEFWIDEGNKLEKIQFNTSCSVYVPGGVAHFPLFFRNVKTPIMMGVVVPKIVGDLQNTPVSRG
jgi:hypothetical protein